MVGRAWIAELVDVDRVDVAGVEQVLHRYLKKIDTRLRSGRARSPSLAIEPDRVDHQDHIRPRGRGFRTTAESLTAIGVSSSTSIDSEPVAVSPSWSVTW